MRHPLGRRTAQGAVAVAGATILVVETLAARLVAPHVGLTLESNTAAIGVALLGIALGASLGGRLADRFDARNLAGTAMLVGAALVLLVRPLVRVVGPSVPPGALSAMLLVLVSTLPAVTALSVVAPAVVRASLRDVEHSGRVVGSLSATGTIGSLAGTFLTGFVFVATLPLGAILTLSAVVTAGTALVLLRWRRAPLLVAAAALPLGGVALAQVEGPCEVETTYYCARVEVDPERPSGRVLYLDNLRHSYVDLDDPSHLEYTYTQRIADTVDAVHPGERPLDVVHVGGGGFTLPQYHAVTREGTRSTVLELDPGIVELDRRELGLADTPGIEVRTGDGRTSLQGVETGSADVVVLDAYGSLSVPWHLTTREFLNEVERVLKPGGVVTANVVDSGPRAFLAAEVATFQATFDDVAVLAEEGHKEGGGAGSYVLIGRDGEVPRDEIQRRSSLRESRGELLAPQELVELTEGAEVLTDEHAPVDQLLTPYNPN